MKLQTQLTLSHLAVTAISVVVLLLGWIGGYALYLRSDFAARWAADWAGIYADEVAFWEEDGYTSPQDYVQEQLVDVGTEPAFDEWLLVVDREGTIIGSNYGSRYPVGTALSADPPPGINANDLFDPSAEIRSADVLFSIFTNVNNRHVGFAPIIDSDDEWQGWVYYHGGEGNNSVLLADLSRNVLWGGLALSGIALLVSGVMGLWLAGFFGRKLTTLQTTSAAFAEGQLSERVPDLGEGEIGRLATQFNQMADTIEQQIGDLRQLADDNARLAEEAEGLARLEERNRLARDLHDAIKQQLFGLNLTLGSVQPILSSKPDIAQQRIAQVVEQTQTIQTELDQIINQLRPASLRDQGLAVAVQQLADQWATQTDVPVAVTINEARPLPIQVEQAAFRIIQEALQNIGKHAQAESVQVRLSYMPQALAVAIEDDGVGFDIATIGRSSGLRNMNERVTALDGTLVVESSKGRGTLVHATLPLEREW